MTQQRTPRREELRTARGIRARAREFQDDISARRNERCRGCKKTLGEGCAVTPRRKSFDVVLSTEGVVYAAPAYDVRRRSTALQGRNAASRRRPRGSRPRRQAAAE